MNGIFLEEFKKAGVDVSGIEQKIEKPNYEKDNVAIAPFNFINIRENNKPIVALYKKQDKEQNKKENNEKNNSDVKLDVFDKKLFTGEIEITLKSKTPFIVGDSTKDKKDPSKVCFFSVKNEIPQVSGSSFRGMVRNIFEIVSFSKFNNINNHRFYFRNVADGAKSPIGIAYDEVAAKLVPKKDNNGNEIIKNGKPEMKKVSKAHMGYLKCNGFRDYVIYPANYEYKHDKSDKELKNNAHKIMGKAFDFDVYSGYMNSKKTYYHIAEYKEDKSPIKLDYQRDVLPYKLDYENAQTSSQRKNYSSKTKSEEDITTINLFERLEEKRFKECGVPCFYIQAKDTNGNDYVFFGNTKFIRVPYFYTTLDCVDGVYKKDDKYDLTEFVFGKEGEFATRVFFEDLKLKNQEELQNKDDLKAYLDENIYTKEETTEPLLAPKPTAFNLYLANNEPSKILTYNGDANVKAKLKGFKMYHHKNLSNDLKEAMLDPNKDEKAMKNVLKSFKAVKSGVEFVGKIRFLNLKKEELGALLYSLNVDDKSVYKLGGAKPLGFGSVELKSTLKLFDIDKKYSDLFANDYFKKYENNSSDSKIKELVKHFKDITLKSIKENSKGFNDIKSYDDFERIKELKAMLDFKNTSLPNWDLNTKYMVVNFDKNSKNTDIKFDRKLILPSPRELKDHFLCTREQLEARHDECLNSKKDKNKAKGK
ncbi:TIGR03986 family CRISPR-associated RAMP protein [Campylobacter canadensis]|nr:TIGR03986 family CRISPR-associated RAMP protein [Campylobacter canadensis]MBZ7995537.1 TIGR03986 family CRISPR-associated RAMP protein [Campylobacter canadensis]MBZ7996628.1 TIGR03986 family CRISPR-associated RAMP protein [Campylobacter canadensis]MBZ8002700.1 TIGR03986 family CRISPR-associated RAMP protein [Campylobacter canadensis]